MFPARLWREIPQRYRLEAARCDKCGKVFYPPRRVCDACKGREFTSMVLPDEGTLVTYTVIRVAPPGFGDEVPYAVGIVDLGPVKTTVQVTDLAPEDVKVGMKVRLAFRAIQRSGHSGLHAYGRKAVPA